MPYVDKFRFIRLKHSQHTAFLCGTYYCLPQLSCLDFYQPNPHNIEYNQQFQPHLHVLRSKMLSLDNFERHSDSRTGKHVALYTPTFSASKAASSSAFSIMRSANLLSSLPRCRPGHLRPQVVLNAFFAAATATSTSSFVPKDIWVITLPVATKDSHQA